MSVMSAGASSTASNVSSASSSLASPHLDRDYHQLGAEVDFGGCTQSVEAHRDFVSHKRLLATLKSLFEVQCCVRGW
jgi:hypothetical protein